MPQLTDLHLRDFGVSPNSAQDSTPLVRSALAAAGDFSNTRIVFEPGTYNFWPDRAAEHYIFPSNNDAGLRAILFMLDGRENVEIDGQGAEFIFHGFIVPFVISKSKNIKLANFSIDWYRTFHTEAIVRKVGVRDEKTGRTVVDLTIPEAFPYIVRHNQIYFTDDCGNEQAVNHSLEFDPERHEQAYQAHDNWGHRSYHYAEELEPGVVRFTSEFSKAPIVGNILAISHTKRDTPGIFVTHSEDVVVEDVTIYHAGAMGVIAQLTNNVRLERISVRPATHKGRIISATADATHFVNCSGTVQLLDCLFEGQLDDATNVHGIYASISKRISDTEIEIELKHEQQHGVHITFAGDRLEFVDQATLLTYHTAAVTAVEIVNRQFCRVTLENALPEQTKAGDAVASLTNRADLIIRGCTARRNRARGFLISTGGKALVENNHVHVSMPAIVIAGDATHWFESGAVHDVLIRNNHFDNCNHSTEHNATIEIWPEIAENRREGTYYHSGIRIENNRFDVFDPRLLRAFCVDGLTFRNNQVTVSEKYPPGPADGKPVDLNHCKNVDVEFSPS